VVDILRQGDFTSLLPPNYLREGVDLNMDIWTLQCGRSYIVTTCTHSGL
jgi:hypothetical protein